LIVKDGTRPLVKLYFPICPLAILPLTTDALASNPLPIEPLNKLNIAVPEERWKLEICPEAIDPLTTATLPTCPLVTLPDE
jgi:hypothetical protein